MTKSKTFTFQFSPIFWLNLLAVIFVLLKLTGVIHWAWGWVFFPWFVSMALWTWGATLLLIGRIMVARAKRAHPARWVARAE